MDRSGVAVNEGYPFEWDGDEPRGLAKLVAEIVQAVGSSGLSACTAGVVEPAVEDAKPVDAGSRDD